MYDQGEREKIHGSQIGVRGQVTANKAMRQALADHVTGHQATFNAATGSLLAVDNKKPPNAKPKSAPKAGFVTQVRRAFD